MRAPLLALLGACSGEPAPCPAGSARRADGLCHLVQDGAGADTAVGDTAGDTGTEGSWQVLPADCRAPDELVADPLVQVGTVFVQDSVFAELVDIDADAATGVAWGAGQGGLLSVDISNPAAPRFLAATAPTAWMQRAYQVHVGPAPAVYATHRDRGLAAWDRSDPRAPALRTVVDLPDAAGMASTEDHLYVLTHGGALVTLDIGADPLAPAPVASLAGLGNPWRAALAGDRLYVADNSLGIVVVDLSTPAEPALSGSVAAAGGAQDLDLSRDGGTLYAAVGGAGVEVFSLDDPDRPTSLGTLDLHHSVVSVAVEGDLLWAATQQDVVAIDISTPRSPRVRNTEQTTQWAMAVDGADGHAVVADWGYLSTYALTGDGEAPDLDPASTEVHLDRDAADTVEVELANLGDAPLSLRGAASSDDRVRLEVDRTTVPPGGSARLRLHSAGGGNLDAEICLATDDPDEPVVTLAARSGGTGGDALGREAPDFALKDLDGTTWRLSEQRGHPVVLVYFATW